MDSAAELPANAHAGESTERQIVVICLCLAYLFVLTLQHGIRYGEVQGQKVKSHFVEILFHVQFYATIAIICSVTLLEAGLAMVTDRQCHAATLLCLALFGVNKTSLYMVFNERVHSLRVPYTARIRDPVWVLCTFSIVGGVVITIVFVAVVPWARLDHKSGQCRILIPSEGIIGFCVFLFSVGVFLTGIFIFLLWPRLRWRMSAASRYPSLRCDQGKVLVAGQNGHPAQQERTKDRWSGYSVLCKNVMGWVTMLFITLINCTVYITKSGAKRSHICLLSCLTDAACSMFITTLLIKNYIDNERTTERTPVQVLYNPWNRAYANGRCVCSSMEMTSDSWTNYMQTLRQEPHTNFNMRYIDGRMPSDTASLSILPEIIDQEGEHLGV
ncbi:hypothetical protein BU23DRAFT_537413 [Bimuria novae-zelandiae CBS 107.79]|uniref:G-protein coupled receptors family 1 profile domain-containing protein n=1 Tax=Bimuria novae-zelandiae CBS 107.79 TaxID=1447943 RepID=A0A6A5V3U2_9PLEO|nr:hypothetical protein BU23DRAFT_537413 [Bimuria novae-zelandiae CBS 107.79]